MNTQLNSTKPDPTRPMIAVGFDNSSAAVAALRWAVEQARTAGLSLRVVYVWELKALAMAAMSAEAWETASADARARATQWVRDALGADPGIRWSLDIVEGPPGPALVTRSRGARLLVLGTKEHTGLRRVVLGSVSHYCLSHADLPVVAVPALEATAVAS
ncbi:MAG: hypothetical protein QOI54_3160 [Actinomycetota bacterium]|nr:hypothetical protein [Actinomycetota bacterium]